MSLSRRFVLTATLPAIVLASGAASAAPASGVNRDVSEAIERLTRTNETAGNISKKARAVLVFPKIIKVGLILGASYGEGALREGGKTVNYYSSASASYGLQAGAQSYAYAVFLMNDSALKYLRESKGWGDRRGSDCRRRQRRCGQEPLLHHASR